MKSQLTVSRIIAAEQETVFAAFVEPDQLRKWWGPVGVECSHAHVDAREGGVYRIDNQLPDGKVVVIQGEFQTFEPPNQFSYTWRVTPSASDQEELVTIRFEAVPSGTEVTIKHERIENDAIRKSHRDGWTGCLKGLQAHLS